MSSFQLDVGLNQSRVHALDNGQPVINDNDLATLTLLVAEKPNAKRNNDRADYEYVSKPLEAEKLEA
jgi:hypothetical protein